MYTQVIIITILIRWSLLSFPLFLSEMWSHYVDKVCLKFIILLLQSSGCWEYRNVPFDTVLSLHV